MEESDSLPSDVPAKDFRPEMRVSNYLACRPAMDSMLKPCLDILGVTIYCSVGTT